MKVAFLNSTVSQKPPVNKIKARQMAIEAYQQKFEHKFDMNSKAIDLTAMAKNFSHGYVPSKDISEAVKQHGKLFTLKAILAGKQSSRLKIELHKKRIHS